MGMAKVPSKQAGNAANLKRKGKVLPDVSDSHSVLDKSNNGSSKKTNNKKQAASPISKKAKPGSPV